MNKAIFRLAKLSAITMAASLMGCGGGSVTDSDFDPATIDKPLEDWVLVWSDEFDGATIDMDKWSHELNCDGGGNNEQQCYTDSADNSYVENGILTIVAKPAEEGADKPYTSARLRTKEKGDWTYGRFEVRAKLPQGQGSWPAIWMLPTDNVYGGWPNSGEIDIMEAVNLKTVDSEGVVESHVHGTLHYGAKWPNNESSGKEYLLPGNMNPADDFHTYAIEWQEGEMRWYVDDYLFATQMASKVRTNSKGEQVGLVHRGWFTEFFDIATGELTTHYDATPFDQDFHLLLNLAVGGDWAGNVNNTGIDAAAFAEGQKFEIDYVKVYECSQDPNTGKGCETIRSGYKDENTLVEGKAPIPTPPSTGVAENLSIFADEENPLWPAWDCCGGSIPTIETDDAEYGAVVEFVIGAAPTVMGFTTKFTDAPKPFDASPMLTTGKIEFDMKLVTAPANAGAAWLFKVESNDAATAVEIPISTSNEGIDPVVGEWQHYSFDLQALADAGLDLSAIDTIMIFPAWGAGEGAVYRVDNMFIGQANVTYPELVLFEDTTNMEWPLWDCCAGSVPTEVMDDEAHGLVAEFSVLGSADTVQGFYGRDSGSFDASALLTEGVIQFEMKVDSAPAEGTPWILKLEADGNTSNTGDIPLNTSKEGLDPVTGEWQTYTFDLLTLSDAGLDISAIDVVMVFPAWGAGAGAVYRIDNAKIYNPNSGPTLPSLTLYKDAPNLDWPSWDCCGGSTPTEQEDDAAHGMTTEFSIGAAPTVMGFTTKFNDDPMPFDANSLLATGRVKFDMKVISMPGDGSAAWLFKVESGDATTAVELPITDSQEGVAPVAGEWQTYTFSLQDLFDKGLDLSEIDTVMVFPAWGAGEGAVYRVDNFEIAAP
ncbi:family 16 glycosylhydrolase [Alteromonadaceae bacterium BrNp21-10]|nr:family 16 glycosylhydrolase [Alteromonadaceae bacterium BrNp21-10]